MLCDFLQEINITALNHSGSLLKLNPDKGKPLWVTRAFGARICKWTWRSVLEEWVVGVEGPPPWEGGRSQKGQTKVPRDCWGGEKGAEGRSQVAGDL